MTLLERFERCLNIPYVTLPNSADVAVERAGGTLYIYLEHSDGNEDWHNNLDFPAKPYRRMNDGVWYAHRGFVRVWKRIEDYLAPLAFDPTVRRIVTVGYSHGGALAVLCHEYVWYHRPDLRDLIEGYGFGAPRVIRGPLSPALARRWERFTVVRNLDDLVTHLPPRVLGYTHVGRLLEIGEKGRYSPIDAHRAENILAELVRSGQ
ncbi:MAG: hypothetical protein J6R04_05790 [Clostridia bacterium]|nr:hypothetical protein [Clostridia bacterium]